jgi:putative salt-induced outer membrane protein
MWKRASLGLIGLGAMCCIGYADDTPAPATADTSAPASGNGWASRASAGYTKTGGNTDTSTANALFHIAHVEGSWKFLFGADGLYGSTHGETTAQAWEAHFQANYNFTDRFYQYGSLRYDDNKFSGFAYQETASTGVGYQFIKTDATKLSAQVGVGVQRLKPELLTEDSVGAITSTTQLPGETDAVLDAALNLDHSLNASTKIIAGVAVESGHLNTMTSANIALQVKMTNVLALSAGYGLVRNSNPPPGIGASATLTTLNLVYELKNPKLAPE